MEKVMIELIIGSQVNRLHDDKKKTAVEGLQMETNIREYDVDKYSMYDVCKSA